MAGSFLLTLAHGQQALGHEVAVVVPHAAGLPMEEELAGVAVYRYRYGRDAEETLAYVGTMHEQALASWVARWRLLRLVQASRREVRRVCDVWQPDVLHVHWWVPGGFAVWPSLPDQPPVVLTSHGTDVFLLDRFPMARPLAAPIFKAAAQVTVISSPLVERVESLGVPPSRISVIPMPVALGRFEAASDRTTIGNRLLFVGRLVERKGAHVAIEALEVLKRKGREAHLTVVGDGPERDRLEALADQKGVSPQVDFQGTVPAESVAHAFAKTDVFLMPAVTDWKGEQEGFGLVLVEAMMSGVPVVASESGGIPDVVTDGETGLLVPEHDPEGLAGAIERLLSDSALGRRLARAAAKEVRRRFAPEAIARRFEAVYSRATEVAGR
ncbi:MAG: glycosyltransferase family 4 protein [Gemmatimonadales bacterium]|nr:glycosyltransferase family 4 protein [Gemmatimonadales bacterium]